MAENQTDATVALATPQPQYVALAIAPAPAPVSGLSALRVWLETLGKLLPILAVIAFAIWFHVEIALLLRNTTHLEVPGIKLDVSGFKEQLRDAASKPGSVAAPSDQLAPLYRKLNGASGGLQGMRALWVDDRPENNFALRRVLTKLGVLVDVALYNEEAIAKARRADYDFIISDFGRKSPDGNVSLAETGGDFAKWMQSNHYEAPLLIYSGSVNNIPNDVPRLLATNRPADLLNAIADLGIEAFEQTKIARLRTTAR